jgi:hypothetical protein
LSQISVAIKKYIAFERTGKRDPITWVIFLTLRWVCLRDKGLPGNKPCKRQSIKENQMRNPSTERLKQSKRRIEAAVRLEATDRVPVALGGDVALMKYTNPVATTGDFVRDPWKALDEVVVALRTGRIPR